MQKKRIIIIEKRVNANLITYNINKHCPFVLTVLLTKHKKKKIIESSRLEHFLY